MPAVDFVVFNHILKGIKKATREHYTAYDSAAGEWATVPTFGTTPGPGRSAYSTADDQTGDTVTTASASIISIIMAVTAAYLSWTCDYTSGGNLPLKILQTVIAALFGSLYIVFFLVFLFVPCSGIVL